jgi:hypothetical protein
MHQSLCCLLLHETQIYIACLKQMKTKYENHHKKKKYNYGIQEAESHILDVITTLAPAHADPLL